MKIHKQIKDKYTTFLIYCSTPWIDNGKNKITKFTKRWKKVTCEKCLKRRKFNA